jgi:hypothetical protein
LAGEVEPVDHLGGGGVQAEGVVIRVWLLVFSVMK